MLKTYKANIKTHYKNNNFSSSYDNKTNTRLNFMLYWADSTQLQNSTDSGETPCVSHHYCRYKTSTTFNAVPLASNLQEEHVILCISCSGLGRTTDHTLRTITIKWWHQLRKCHHHFSHVRHSCSLTENFQHVTHSYWSSSTFTCYNLADAIRTDSLKGLFPTSFIMYH